MANLKEYATCKAGNNKYDSPYQPIKEKNKIKSKTDEKNISVILIVMEI